MVKSTPTRQPEKVWYFADLLHAEVLCFGNPYAATGFSIAMKAFFWKPIYVYKDTSNCERIFISFNFRLNFS